MQRPVLRQYLRHAAAFAAADGPIFRRAARLLLDTAFPPPAADAEPADGAVELTPLNAEVCVEICISGNSNTPYSAP